MSNSGVHETEDLKRDIIAGATLGPCKNLSRELLRCQIFRPDPKKYQEVNKNFYQCLQNYAEKYQNWGSAEDKHGNVYYFNRETRESQWNRPEEIEKDIIKGKTADDHTELWMECEFLGLQLSQCEKTGWNESGCILEANKFMRCLKERMRNDE